MYDGTGNRLEHQRRLLAADAAPIETSVSVLTPGANRLASVTTAGQLRQLVHDGRGNITTDTRASIPLSLGYDAYSRLTAYVAPSGSMTMRYSGTDERVEAVAGSVARRFAYDENQRSIGEYGTSANDVKAEHIWLMPDLEGDGYEPLAIAGPTTITYVHGDHLGAPALLTDATGSIANRYDALPFGQRWASLAASPTTALAFPGQLIDAVDRHYNVHRDYDPTLGRYLQADPIGLGGGDNPYAYADGSAVNAIDPMGLNTVAAGAAAGVAVGGPPGVVIGGIIGGGILGCYLTPTCQRFFMPASSTSCQIETGDPQLQAPILKLGPTRKRSKKGPSTGINYGL